MFGEVKKMICCLSGWNFAKITDVVVHRVHDGKALISPEDTAQLVNTILQI